MKPTLVWLQRELRTTHLPTLQAALSRPEPVIIAYFHDPSRLIGAANAVWLAHSLDRLQHALSTKGGQLWLLEGDFEANLEAVLRDHRVGRVYYSPHPGEPFISQQQKALEVCRKQQVAPTPFFSEYWLDPGRVLNRQQKPYVVFTPFYRSLMEHAHEMTPLDSDVGELSGRCLKPQNQAWLSMPSDLKQRSSQSWAGQIMARWQVGEAAAWQALETFVEQHLADYDRRRDFPADSGTSRLSVHLHFGEIAPRAIYFYLQARIESAQINSQAAQGWLRQLAWREFARQLLWHFPQTQTKPFQSRFAELPWNEDDEAFRAWCKGQTGIPIVDAGMRELWKTGTMHNRVRMLTASFLTKNLNQHWRKGQAWFEETLLDADPANNTMGWQWVAGCGVDAAPYYRLFNPVRQSEQYDPQGEYIRRWVPELRPLSDKSIHAPWLHADACRRLGIVLGEHYPEPWVDLDASRKRHLQRVEALKQMAKE